MTTIPPTALNSLDDGRASEWRDQLWAAINARYPNDATIISNGRMDFVSAVEAAVQTAMRVAIEEAGKASKETIRQAARVLRDTTYPLTGETAAQLVETYVPQPTARPEINEGETRLRWATEDAATRAALAAFDHATGPAILRMREAIETAERVRGTLTNAVARLRDGEMAKLSLEATEAMPPGCPEHFVHADPECLACRAKAKPGEIPWNAVVRVEGDDLSPYVYLGNGDWMDRTGYRWDQSDRVNLHVTTIYHERRRR